ncbi:MORN repeat-containing protein [Gelidibacter maritimus]|uniref:MORN repeat protein n=1 Tax=Gelidibacter maritimus TaxID=2761487 RepID=A0A7W2M3N1_9FLAO|nr:hypothetical protein [Gelidibacter maritimus]MBA6152092.1 hypothetical protein [Gelidibacter maritimus]
MRQLTILFSFFICANVFPQKIDWINAPNNPIPLAYTLNHFQLKDDVKTSEVFGFNSILFTRFKYHFNQNGFIEQSVYVNKNEPLKSTYTTYLYNNDGTVASKTDTRENQITLIVTYKYNKKKQLIASYFDNKKNPQPKYYDEFEYHSNGFLSKHTQFKDEKAISMDTYDYDKLNRLIQEESFKNGKLTKSSVYHYNNTSDTILEVTVSNSNFRDSRTDEVTEVKTYNNGYLVKESWGTYTLKFDSQNNLLESSFRKLGNNFGGKRFINIYYNPAHNNADNFIEIGCVAGNCLDGYGTYLSGDGYIKAFFSNSAINGFSFSVKNDDPETTTLLIANSGQPVKTIRFSKNRMLEYVNFIEGKISGKYYYVKEGKTTIAEVENGSIRTKYDNNKNDGSVRCITGDCENGFGSILFENGDLFEGFFKNGQSTEGILKLSSGHSYIGAFANGKKFQGSGVLLFPNGDKYMGFWENGLRHGQGVYQFANGMEQAGIWNNDELKTKM